MPVKHVYNEQKTAAVGLILHVYMTMTDKGKGAAIFFVFTKPLLSIIARSLH